VVIPNFGHIGAFLRSDVVLSHVVPFCERPLPHKPHGP
jgi:hypothetical protein